MPVSEQTSLVSFLGTLETNFQVLHNNQCIPPDGEKKTQVVPCEMHDPSSNLPVLISFGDFWSLMLNHLGIWVLALLLTLRNSHPLALRVSRRLESLTSQICQDFPFTTNEPQYCGRGSETSPYSQMAEISPQPGTRPTAGPRHSVIGLRHPLIGLATLKQP